MIFPKSLSKYLIAWIAVPCIGPVAIRAQAISVAGGNQTMMISTALPGAEPTSVVNTICTLSYAKQKVITKVTIVTSCPGQKFNLDVVATGPTLGVAAPQVALISGSPAMDLITSIPKTGAKNGTCTLQFTASATFSQGNSVDLGDDVHTITYTIQAQ